MKRSEVSIKKRSTPASLSFKGQATKHTTVKWSIEHKMMSAPLVDKIIGQSRETSDDTHVRKLRVAFRKER